MQVGKKNVAEKGKNSPLASLSPFSKSPQFQKQEIKALLGRMQFAGKAMHKKAEVLSGGEKARLALAKFMLTK